MYSLIGAFTLPLSATVHCQIFNFWHVAYAYLSIFFLRSNSYWLQLVFGGGVLVAASLKMILYHLYQLWTTTRDLMSAPMFVSAQSCKRLLKLHLPCISHFFWLCVHTRIQSISYIRFLWPLTLIGCNSSPASLIRYMVELLSALFNSFS